MLALLPDAWNPQPLTHLQLLWGRGLWRRGGGGGGGAQGPHHQGGPGGHAQGLVRGQGVLGACVRACARACVRCAACQML